MRAGPDRLQGSHYSELPTPALVLDLDAATRNIDTMAKLAQALGVGVRPHVKAHKCMQLAQLQLDAGSVGLTCATVAELELTCATTASELLLANQVVDPHKLDKVARAACTRSVTIAVDDEEHIASAAAAARRTESSIGIVVEVDLGMHRGGARTPAAVAELAAAAAQEPRLTFRGVHGYEGHCATIDDTRERTAAARTAAEQLAEAAAAVVAAAGTCDVVTTGGTATFLVSGALPAVTEIQPGSYALMDMFHERLTPGTFEPALRVVASVVSRHGTRAVLDAGRKAVAADLAPLGFPTLFGVASASLHEEHCVVDLAMPCRLGDRVDIIPGYAPTTVNLHTTLHVVQDEMVVDAWPIGRV